MNDSDQTQSEFQLIEEILNGNREGYRKFVDRYSPMVFHVVRKFEKDEEEVKELAQQIFVKAYEKLESFNRQSKFSSWLYSLASNQCRDYVKNVRYGNQRFSEMEEDYLENRMIDPDTTPYQDLENSEWKKLLKQALGDLGGDYSEPFLMKYRDGMSYKAMSERMGVGVSALKVRVHRARKELKTLIEKQM
ncbi:MAG: sigma-70 family RNA polymerase sigma factor [Balneolaceae bacterium]